MHDLTRKIATALATGSVALATLSGSAFAESNFEVSGNGAGSRNRISVNSEHRVNVHQENNADVRNDVSIDSNTGGNEASFNTRGDVRIRTGDAHSDVYISNRVNENRFRYHHSDHHDDENNNGNSGNGNGNGNNDGEARENQRRLSANLNGENEVPGPGDPDGSGEAKVRLHPKKGEVCVKIEVDNIAQATMAHIHEGNEDVAGPVVVTLPTPDENGLSEGCVALGSEKLREIRDNPSHYYVNIHNSEYPDGAVRGQLFN